jgi:outer membrane cobalamin receptor
MRNIAASQISSIHFIRGTDAVTTYGMQYGAGVIDIRTR